jgi:hypothetical protein
VHCFLFILQNILNSKIIYIIHPTVLPDRVFIKQSKGALKVVGNENGGGSGGWLLFEDGFRPWWSMSVYFLMLKSS